MQVSHTSLDPKLSFVSTIRIAEEEQLVETFDECARLAGYDKFYLKVGGVLHTKHAEIGLAPDGVVTNSAKEHIEVSKRFNEEIKLESHKKRLETSEPSLRPFYFNSNLAFYS